MVQQAELRDGQDGDGGAAAPFTRPRWFAPAAWVLTLTGLALSAYLAVAHYREDTLVCTATSTIDCHAVTASEQSELAGIPLPLLGLAFFAGFAGLITPAALRSPHPVPRWGRLAGVCAGLLFVVYLVTVELAVLQKICLWCTGVHAVTVLLFVLVLIDEFRRIGAADRPAG
jgi:uncharacterized membrane protein